jgi:hypothetical protein
MIDALFWYTGLIAWVLIVFACVSMLAVEAHDRSVMRRGRNIAQLLGAACRGPGVRLRSQPKPQ